MIADLGNPIGGQPYKFGSKELITANGLNEYDFGARQYYSAVPGFTKPDPLAEKYPWLSPYLYCANNTVNAFDPDGNIIIFVNGMHFGDGGTSKYWNGVDTSIKQILQDKNAVYIDGSFGGFINTLINDTYSTNVKASNRIKMGAEIGALYAKSIYNKLTEGETIILISHSMGGAASKGFLQSLLEYAKENNIEPKIAFELDMAPFQWAEQKGNPHVATYTLSHKSDRLAGESNMKNAINFHSDKEADNPNPLAGHKIESFKDEVVRLIREGKIETSVKY